jgi:hypothetical protein
VQISDQPDLLFFSCYGFNYLQYNCHRVYFTGENSQADYRLCDFSITFNWDEMMGKNMRLPLFRFNSALETLTEKKYFEPVNNIPNKFCCTVVSNAGCKERNNFFDALSSYKLVDSGGRYRNNVGGPVANKEEFIKDYKFLLCFENIASPGYTTEKIIDPLFKRNIPVYWGNKVIGKDFNIKRFVNVQDYKSFDTAVEAIINIDQDDQLYNQYVCEPAFKDNIFPEHLTWVVLQDKLISCIKNVVAQVPVAIKYPFYGRRHQLQMLIRSKISGKPIWLS